MPSGINRRMFGLSTAELETILPIVIVVLLVLAATHTLFILLRDSPQE